MPGILLVEDDEELRATLREMLEMEGYEVVEAGDTENAIRLYREKPLDIIITDIMLPGESGIALIEKLRCDYPEVGIIAITGFSAVDKKDFLRMAKILGAKKVLRKPFGRQEILEMVEELCVK